MSCWRLARGFGSLPHGPLQRAAPKMTAYFPQSKRVKKKQQRKQGIQKLQSFINKRRSDIPLLLPPDIGHTDQSWYRWKGTTYGCEYLLLCIPQISQPTHMGQEKSVFLDLVSSQAKQRSTRENHPAPEPSKLHRPGVPRLSHPMVAAYWPLPILQRHTRAAATNYSPRHALRRPRSHVTSFSACRRQVTRGRWLR